MYIIYLKYLKYCTKPTILAKDIPIISKFFKVSLIRGF